MKRVLAWTLTVAMCIGLFTGCGASASPAAAQGTAAADEAMSTEEFGMGSEGEAPVLAPQDQRKIVYTATVDLESKRFDDAHDALLEVASKANAYVQSSEEGGSAEQGSRWVNYTFRVPSEHYREFLNGAQASGNLLRKEESTEDVTAEYVDVEARLESLKNQEQRLTELSAKAESLEDLLSIENQLTQVRYQIESYTGQKRVMDNLITYSTVSVYLSEVQTLTPKDNSFTTRVGEAFQGSWKKFVGGLQNLLIGLIYLLPELILLGLIAGLVVFCVRIGRKKRAEKLKNMPKPTAPPPQQPQQSPEGKTPAMYEKKD